MFGLKRFGDAHLERLYIHQQLHHHGAVLVYVLCVFTAALLLLALNHLPNPDMTLLLATISAACALALNILLNIQSAAHQHGTVVAIGCWLSTTVLCMLPAGGQHALLPVIIAHFALYTLFPFGIFPTLGICSTLSLAQITAFILLPSQSVFTLDQLLATILVHIWSNFIGVYLFSTRNRLCRAAFLNARNALSSQQEALQENTKMAILLSSALPAHVITSVQSQLDLFSVIYAKIYGLQIILNQISVQDSARLLNEFNTRIDQLVKRYSFVRIQSDAIIVLSGVPHIREDHALAACHFSRDLITLFRSFCDATMADLQLKVGIGSGSISSGIIGAKKWHYDVIGMAYDNAKQLESKADFGSIIISDDTKRLVESDFATEKIDYGSWCLVHVLACSSSLVAYSKFLPSLLFPANHRRFSLVTLPQAINRVLQSSNLAVNEANLIKANSTSNAQPGRRKKKSIHPDPLCEKFDDEDMENDALLKMFSMKFVDQQLEKSFHMQMDRWFIPALAISILFLVVYGLYQVLVMPRLITTLALIIVALAIMFIVLLMLYINYFESFCHFITRTSAGHSVSILLIIVVLFMCGIVNTFSCPSFSASPVCHVVHYSLISCAIWMLTTAVFVRFSSLYLLASLVVAMIVYSIHVFATHVDLYFHFSLAVGWRVEFDLLIGLVTLTMLIFLQSRRNERLIRLDYLSVLKTVEDNRQLERFEYLNEQILLNALPTHIAHSYGMRTEPYHHLCHTVGILSAKFGNGSDWQGEFGFDRLNRIIYEVDKLVEVYTGLEKVRSSHCIYTAAVGVLPEVSKNVNDAPFTIGDLLASLTSFASKVKQIGDNEGVDIAIGIDCGSALSLVVGIDRPRYEVIGVPCTRAAKLMEAAASMFHQKENRTMVSEEIFLALRPRTNFCFDERNPVTVAPALIGYVLLENSDQRCAKILPIHNAAQQRHSIQSSQNTVVPVSSLPSPLVNHVDVGESSAESATDFDDADEGEFMEDNAFLPDDYDQTQSTAIAHQKSQCSLVLPSDLQALANDTRINGLHRQMPVTESNNGVDSTPNRNPLEMFGSMNSSFSSEMYSIDVSVETDSEMEWITPDMIANNSDYRANYAVCLSRTLSKTTTEGG
uniref:adenylate cyclase n=1 Tax=Ditylenchus dipsaci TaxID=166011 RepID=A0A915CN09_9BILA